ncbi:MAG: class I SAM-dependent methyltransferase [Cytophagales bacterium]|nr:class I SAM-dependent methyltransferase [Cytophagales bacterium]
MPWYKDWFNSPYYHILYGHHNDVETKMLIDNLTDKLHFQPHYHILDLACGRGRHSKYLNTKGYRVTGIDIAENNIIYAKTYENDTLQFEVHDMREPYAAHAFDVVLNIFTSFGYFKDHEANLQTLRAVHTSLKNEGILIIDYFNTSFVLQNLVCYEEKHIDNIHFNINRYEKQGYIYKHIEVNDQGKISHFQENVRAFYLHHFEEMLNTCNFHINDVFGDYSLHDFEQNSSPRLILHVSKK